MEQQDARTERYWAFISYSHEDRRWARWLHCRLEAYRVPRRLVGRVLDGGGQVPRRLAPIFRDRDELPSSADLGGVIARALHDSRYLIVLCSPRSAQSRWVNQEVDTFKRLGRESRVLCLRLGENDGEVYAPALRERYDASGTPTGQAAEPLAADLAAHADGRDGALLKLIAGMLGIGYDELRQRERRRRWRDRALTALAAALLMMLLVTGWRWQQDAAQRALAAQALDARVAQLIESGRREALAHNEARAAVLLNEVRRLGRGTPAVDRLLGRVMRAVDAQRLRIDTGHTLRLVGLDAQGQRLFTVDVQRMLRLYDARSGALQHSLALGVEDGMLLEFSEGGRYIWIDSDHAEPPRRRLRLVEAASGRIVREVAARAMPDGVALPMLDAADRHFVYVDEKAALVVDTLAGGRQRLPGPFAAARPCADGRAVLAARDDGSVELRTLPALQLQRRFDGLREVPTMLAATADCSLVAAGARDGTVRVWSAADAAVRMSAGLRETITDLVLSADGTRLLAASFSDMSVWNPRKGSLYVATRQRSRSTNLTSMSADGQHLARLADGRLVVLDPLSGEERYRLDAQRGGVRSFAFGAHGRQLLSAGNDGSLVVWDLPAERVLELRAPAIAAAREHGTPLAVSGDARRFATVGAGGGVEIWNVARLQREHGFDFSAPRALAFSADGRTLAMAGDASGIALVDVDRGAVRWQQAADGVATLLLELSADARYLALARADGFAEVWDLASSRRLLRLPRDKARAQALAPQAAQIATGDRGAVELRALDDGRLLWRRELPRQAATPAVVGVLAFSADGRFLLATAKNREAFVLDARDGRVLQRMLEPASVDFSVASFNADATQVLIGDASSAGLLWDLQRDRLRRLDGHTAAVRTASFSADASLALTAGEDGVLKLWDVTSGDLLDSFSAHEGAVLWDHARFVGADLLLSGGSDGAARLWPLPRETRAPQALAAHLACRVPWRVEQAALLVQQAGAQHCAAAADAHEKAAGANAGGS